MNSDGSARRRLSWLPFAAGAALLAIALAIAVVALLDEASRPPESLPLDPHPSSSFRIVALGDSFTSGEGARNYFPGTDEPGRNECHRAATAYPYLVADELDASLTFLACSGARTSHLTGFDPAGNPVPGQQPRSGPGVFGARPQVAVLREVEEPDAVLVGIGGNDAGFVEIGTACAVPLLPDCRRSASFWLNRLDTVVYPALVGAYRAVREASQGAPVFALTYPNPIGPRFCRDLAGLDPAEMGFLRDVFVSRLNEIVSSAAARARVRVIDLSEALRGRRFCEVRLPQAAINFIVLGRTSGTPIELTRLGLLAHGSLHPNPVGHRLMRAQVSPVLRAARRGRLAPLPPPPGPGERPPPFVPEETLPASPFPTGTECSGPRLAVITPLLAQPGVRSVSLTGATPRSTVCFRSYRDEWESTRADSDGVVRVPVDVRRQGLGSINEILLERPSGAWEKVVVSRLREA